MAADEEFEGYGAALAFFRAVEHTPMDDEHNDVADALVQEYGPDEILRGLALVAAVIREELIHHAARLGCGCGSNAWLDNLVYENAATDHE